MLSKIALLSKAVFFGLILAGQIQGFSVNPLNPADYGEHGLITRLALSRYNFSEQALVLLDKGNSRQDLYPMQFKRHYIRWNWETIEIASIRSRRYLEKEMTTLLNYIGSSRFDKAFIYLGGCLHTVQDVFSHSNYCDMYAEDQEKFINAVVYGGKLPENTLLTGSPLPDRFDRYNYTHTCHAKDTPQYPEGAQAFRIAKLGAIKGSIEVLKLVKDMLDEQVGSDSACIIWHNFTSYGK